MTTATDPVVLAERLSADGRVLWQARRSADRGRLEVVVIVPPSDTPTTVERLNDAELRALLNAVPAEMPEMWVCRECGALNDRARRWCRTCSEHRL